MREVDDEHETSVRERFEAPLGLVPVTLFSRLFAGAPFAAAWSAAVVVPLIRVVESDVPDSIFVGAMFLATIAPVLLYLRRHALRASLRWDGETITLLRGGRVATAIAWRDATIRQRGSLPHDRVVRIDDATGRSITLTTGASIGDVPEGRVRIEPRALLSILRAAGTEACSDATPLPISPTPLVVVALLSLCVTIAVVAGAPHHGAPQLAAIAFACACALLLIGPARRLHAALTRPVGRETLVIDLEERGRVRARRLDGSRVLLDLSAAQHPDVLLAARRGFVNAVLDVPNEARGIPYRSLESPIPATFVETRDDRVLRFEHLRTALVDVIGYGAFFATALAAALVPS